MSRIGRMPIAIPDGVTVTIAENNHVTVTGPREPLREFSRQRWRSNRKVLKSLSADRMI